jgi:hypothetical protein
MSPEEGEDRARASRKPFEPCPPPFERLVVGHRRRDQRQEYAAAPSFVGDPHESFVLLRSPSPRIIVGPHDPRVGAEENERGGPIRVGSCEQGSQPASLGEAEERRALRIDGVEHREHVVYLLFQRRKLCRSVGEPRSPHVQDD